MYVNGSFVLKDKLKFVFGVIFGVNNNASKHYIYSLDRAELVKLEGNP
ncbi:hypothetical protein F0310_04975 (plasmid) [Borrelia sp. A-FGy1]|nr:hypothetical protein F0310_04975 [Borrelia sp. A-FGy1]